MPSHRPRSLCLLALLLALSRSLPAAGQLGPDASLAIPLAGPFRPQAAPGFALSAMRDLDPSWSLGLAYSQHTFFESDYYVSARSIDLRLRKRRPFGERVLGWAELGVGINPMAWHYSNWPGWTRLSAEAGTNWGRDQALRWELGLGLAAYGPPEQGLLQAVFRVGPRWNWGR